MEKKDTKIVFMGTPEFARIILERICESGYKINLVYIKPDNSRSKPGKSEQPAVKIFALSHNLKIAQPQDLKNQDVITELKKIDPDLIIVAAYGKILPKVIIEIPKRGAINVHASLLPALRGASPIQNAILEGFKETGVSIMLVDESLDTGKILAQKKLLISPDDNTQTLSEKLAALGADLLIQILPDWLAGKLKPASQDENLATYSKIIKKEDGEINWHASAESIWRQWRAMSAWPQVFTYFQDGSRKRRIKIMEMDWKNTPANSAQPGKVIKYGEEIAVAANPGLVLLKRVQQEGKKVLDAQEFLRGKNNFLNSKLG